MGTDDRTVSAIVDAWNTLSDEERKSIKTAMDANKDGKLTYAEALAYASARQDKREKLRGWAVYIADKACDLLVCAAAIIAAVIAGIIG